MFSLLSICDRLESHKFFLPRHLPQYTNLIRIQLSIKAGDLYLCCNPPHLLITGISKAEQFSAAEAELTLLQVAMIERYEKKVTRTVSSY